MTSTPTKIPSPAFLLRIIQPPHWGRVHNVGKFKTVDKYDHRNVDKKVRIMGKTIVIMFEKETILLGSAR